jgi:possible transcriptional regulator
MDIKKILDKIAKRRKKKGYSYENMAEDLGLTPSGYRKIEKGETKLSVERLFQIAAALDISVNKLLNIDESITLQIAKSSNRQIT